MTSLLSDMFGVSKPIIAMLRLPALPGRPRHDRRAAEFMAAARRARESAVSV
jgi:predicted TIM-barrel enzyme